MKSKKRYKYTVLLMNDNVNSFDHVSQCLMDICNHNFYQAIQCANIVHTTGRCEVFTSDKEEVETIYGILKEEGLSVDIIKR